MKKKTIKIIGILAGVYLILDGAISIVFFIDQPFTYHIARIIRIIVGKGVLIYFVQK